MGHRLCADLIATVALLQAENFERRHLVNRAKSLLRNDFSQRPLCAVDSGQLLRIATVALCTSAVLSLLSGDGRQSCVIFYL